MTGVKVVPFEGLLVDFAKEMSAGIVVRGLRAVTDFEYVLPRKTTVFLPYYSALLQLIHLQDSG